MVVVGRGCGRLFVARGRCCVGAETAEGRSKPPALHSIRLSGARVLFLSASLPFGALLPPSIAAGKAPSPLCTSVTVVEYLYQNARAGRTRDSCTPPPSLDWWMAPPTVTWARRSRESKPGCDVLRFGVGNAYLDKMGMSEAAYGPPDMESCLQRRRRQNVAGEASRRAGVCGRI